MNVPLADLQAQRVRLGPALDQAMQRVLEHGGFIMGPEVAELEGRLASACGARHALTCASGTDALALPLMAWGVGRGDAVFVPAFTFVATAEVVALAGATPVFVDVDEATFNIEPGSLEAAVADAARQGLMPRVVIPVDLFGHPASYAALRDIADRHGLKILADAAQSFGATVNGARVGTLADATATSFFPAKPLGCYGDGGAVFTDDDETAAVLRSLRVHGQGTNKYDNVRVGLNARLDTLQAAVLLAKLDIFDDEVATRQRLAERYRQHLHNTVAVPQVAAGHTSVWAQYTLRSERRDAIAAACREAGIATAIYYPMPLTRQPGYSHYPAAPGGAPVSERLAGEVVSIPVHPYLEQRDQDRVIAAVRAGAQSPRST